MPSSERNATKNALTAILLYELSRLETLPEATQALIAAEPTLSIQTLRLYLRESDAAFHQSQAAYFASLRRDALAGGTPRANLLVFTVASIMQCIHKAFEIDGLQEKLVQTTTDWLDSVSARQTFR